MSFFRPHLLRTLFLSSDQHLHVFQIIHIDLLALYEYKDEHIKIYQITCKQTSSWALQVILTAQVTVERLVSQTMKTFKFSSPLDIRWASTDWALTPSLPRPTRFYPPASWIHLRNSVLIRFILLVLPFLREPHSVQFRSGHAAHPAKKRSNLQILKKFHH